MFEKLSTLKELENEKRASEIIKIRGKEYFKSLFGIVREAIPRIIGYKYYEKI
jgi:hypothetical protein